MSRPVGLSGQATREGQRMARGRESGGYWPVWVQPSSRLPPPVFSVA
jgi:hypothetical protein